MRLNNLLASPGFELLAGRRAARHPAIAYTPEGKPRVAIFSIAHLSRRRADVLRLAAAEPGAGLDAAPVRAPPACARLSTWTRSSATSRRSANPPSKTPLLTLLKQARAFGVGVVLATQNPVDLDYKGLANCGTWFLGRLQTERDKQRVLDGLEGASPPSGAGFDRAALEKILSGLGNRVFLLHNVHEDQPTVFITRSALCSVHGPLTRRAARR